MSFIMLDNVALSDSPAYSHRGFSLDTVRNFIPVEKLKEVKKFLILDCFFIYNLI